MARAAAARGAIKLGRRALKEIKKNKVSEPTSNVKTLSKKVYDRSARGRTPTKSEEAASFKKESRAAKKEAESKRTKPTPKSRAKKIESLKVDRTESSKKAKAYLEKNQPARRKRKAARVTKSSTSRSGTKSRFVDPRGGGNQ
jgi:hypothetical protein